MPADPTLSDLAAMVVELRAIAAGLRAAAARMASRPAPGAGTEVLERERARRARPELERAERRAIGGAGGFDGPGGTDGPGSDDGRGDFGRSGS